MTATQVRRREATRQRLYEAAVTLIAEQGFSATTVDQIAERAGVAKGTVYYNFASKTALFEALLEHGVRLLTEEFRSAAAGKPPVDALDAVVRAELQFIARYQAFAQLLASEIWRTNRAWQQTLRLVRDEAVSVIEGVVRAGVDGGDYRPDLDTHLAASAVFGMVLVVALDWLAFQPDRSLDDVHATLGDLLRGRINPASG
jgi:AcrR family transcriptional regulator